MATRSADNSTATKSSSKRFKKRKALIALQTFKMVNEDAIYDVDVS